MTRKDFELLALVVSDTSEAFQSNHTHAYFACVLAQNLAETNPRFDVEKFVMAAMPRTHVGTRHANVWERKAVDTAARIATRRQMTQS